MLHLTELRFRDRAPRDTQAIHRTVLYALDTGDPGRVLWALPRRGLLIVQAQAPVRAASIGGVIESHSAEVVTRWPVGTAIRLSLIANPTAAIAVAGRAHGQRVPLPADEHEAWLRRKLGSAIALDEVTVQPLGIRTGRHHERRVAHFLAAFTAAGAVIDTDALEQLIVGGVGAGKAYGAGLLLVAAA